MAFFDKLQEVAKTIGEKTSETMKVVGDKTSDAVEITKHKAKISQEKSAILDLKKQIGELVWNEYSEGGQVSDDIAELCTSIKEHYDVISAEEAQIENVKTKPAEPECADVQNAAEPETESEEPVQEAEESAAPAEEETAEADDTTIEL